MTTGPATGRSRPQPTLGAAGEQSPPALGGGEIGPRLRRLRESAGVSLSELARRAGIGKATLSGLEHGTRNPTLDTLWSVTAALGVPITALLGQAETAVVRGTAVEAALLQVFDEREVTFELYRMTVPPGPAQTSPAHHAGVTEHITVFSGVLRAGPADAPLLAGPGEHLTWQADVPHLYAAVGDTPVTASLLIRYPR
ncbi:XRE family transcriptional regulator [Catellatospora sp. TT07R-123]|uniref:helix-turn-helix domain-containing protein n=1 Tax=Catellatospora sp. TT07R-123 TaxID=2733863 RepID=UPI001B05F598|nr:XRE family transcriptional regulator [Catellatospora sp. TT07R-123]GHJ44690.1 XRE family transcriptional regulator [Catellatospora sp. TT07R-123]